MEFIDYGSLTDILEQYPKGLQLSEPEIAFVCMQVRRGGTGGDGREEEEERRQGREDERERGCDLISSFFLFYLSSHATRP